VLRARSHAYEAARDRHGFEAAGISCRLGVGRATRSRPLGTLVLSPPERRIRPFRRVSTRGPDHHRLHPHRLPGGEVTVGNRTVALTKPLIVQGGAEGASEEVTFYGAENGETLSSAPQPVPGGLDGVKAPEAWPEWLQKWFDQGLKGGQSDVNATIELAAPAGRSPSTPKIC